MPHRNTDAASLQNQHWEGRSRRRSRHRLHCQPMRSGGRVEVFAHWVVLAPPLSELNPSRLLIKSQPPRRGFRHLRAPCWLLGFFFFFFKAPFRLIILCLFKASTHRFLTFIFLAFSSFPSSVCRKKTFPHAVSCLVSNISLRRPSMWARNQSNGPPGQ